MNAIVLVVLLVPLVTSFLILGFPRKKENWASTLTGVASLVHVLSTFGLIFFWGNRGFSPVEISLGALYQSRSYDFPLVVYVDINSVVFVALTCFLSAVIMRYCRYYLHREEGYGRFFGIIWLFVFGLNVVYLSGTLDILFAGWEIVGISSFLLIGFYRDRVVPVRNALRAFTVYRLCDTGLLLGAWLGHLIWHRSQHFSGLASLVEKGHLSLLTEWQLLGLSLLVLLAASGKSALFPFCFWLPRAMEGPTPSSAIFYGGLSIHAGVFLLIRTFPLWSAQPLACWIVGSVGLITAALGALCGRTQSNIKGQLAYASVAQVGLMAVELALGYPNLALLHCIGNACLRTYQLLVSPSVVAHLLRIQSSSTGNVGVSDWSIERLFPSRVRSSMYALSFNEGYLENLIRAWLWEPMSFLGEKFSQVDRPVTRVLGLVLLFALLPIHAFDKLSNGLVTGERLAAVGAVIMAIFSLVAFVERASAFKAWNAVGLSALGAAMTVILADPGAVHDVWIYLVGIAPGWLVGWWCIRGLTKYIGSKHLRGYWGAVNYLPILCITFFISVLWMIGFSLSPTFIGEDVLLHHAVGNHLWLAAIITFVFVTNGITLGRLYSRLCLGPVSPNVRVYGVSSSGN